MSTYQQLQEKLFNQIEHSAKHGKQLSTIVSPVDNYSQDKRLCLTGVYFIPRRLQQKITTDIIQPLQKADPRQYYYLPQTLHLTIQNVRVSSYPPTFKPSDIQKARTAFATVVPRHHKIQFELKQFFHLPTSLAIRAYSNRSLKSRIRPAPPACCRRPAERQTVCLFHNILWQHHFLPLYRIPQ